MSGFITAAGENYMLELMTGAGNTRLAYYIALTNLQPSRNITGTQLDEPKTGNYSRAMYENVSGNWTERVQFVSNTEDIYFPVCDEAWGQISYWALCDEPTGGNVLWAGALGATIYVDVADQVVIPAGGLTIRATGHTTAVML